MRKRTQQVIGVLLFLAFLYWSVSMVAYRYRHPELTETQLSLRMWDALVWRP